MAYVFINLLFYWFLLFKLTQHLIILHHINHNLLWFHFTLFTVIPTNNNTIKLK